MGYPFEITLFNAYREEIRREFTFHDKIVAELESRNFHGNLIEPLLVFDRRRWLFPTQRERSCEKELSLSVSESRTFTSMVLKETIVMYAVDDISASYSTYLQRAINFFTDRHSNVVFVVTSDNVSHTQRLFDGLAVRNAYVSQGTEAGDLCLLTRCNHSIITFGSYSFWSGYLSPGISVYPHLTYTSFDYLFSKSFYEAAHLYDFLPIIFR
ncbi:galactoside alpha-(1,2)-fucosyltransferase 1-like [Hyalella azteca]|uniref:L-Fucosyltransferase n=1 Tax=Hyalella azteca TaxID=294128 RepID=A0A979FTH4_HYAAZ|nr:galactoside alpha-(1,2)-fucosyltransferase 1-like [Hyalella azteca]